MVTISKGKTFTSNEQVTNLKLHQLVDEATITDIVSADIGDGEIIEAKLATSAVTENKIGSGAVTATKLASDAVITAKILDANVTAAKLASDSVTTAKIVDSNVTVGKVNFVSTDGTLGDNADTVVPSEKAVKTYADGNWHNYAGDSTIVGWSSFTTESIFVKKIGKTVFVSFDLVGTSNSANTTFTLPYSNDSMDVFGLLGRTNANPNPGRFKLLKEASQVICGNAYTADAGFGPGGAKTITGQFFYESA